VITPDVKAEMKKILTEIQDGSFAGSGSSRTRLAARATANCATRASDTRLNRLARSFAP